MQLMSPPPLKPVLIFQTYHIGSHHIRAWLECQEHEIDCLFFLNNEAGHFEEIAKSSSIPGEMKKFLHPFQESDYVRLGLPLIPYRRRQIKDVNYYCGDYGFYVAHALCRKCDNIFFVKVDHDVMLYGDSWPIFLGSIDTTFSNSITLQQNTGPSPGWHWHASSKLAYGDFYRFSLFGLQGLPASRVPQLMERRLELLETRLTTTEQVWE